MFTFVITIKDYIAKQYYLQFTLPQVELIQSHHLTQEKHLYAKIINVPVRHGFKQIIKS